MPIFEFHGRKIPYTETNGLATFHNGFDISNMWGIPNPSLATLPRLMMVYGYFACDRTFFPSPKGLDFPPNFTLVVTEGFNCSGCSLITLKGFDNIRIFGDFNCSNNCLKHLNDLPPSFNPGGSIGCWNNNIQDFTNIPEHLKVNREIRKA